MAGEESVELSVLDRAIHCSSCENRIEAALKKVDGVREVKADHRTQKVRVTLDPERSSVSELTDRLSRLGYDVATG